jgi:hypothetical protein
MASAQTSQTSASYWHGAHSRCRHRCRASGFGLPARFLLGLLCYRFDAPLHCTVALAGGRGQRARVSSMVTYAELTKGLLTRCSLMRRPNPKDRIVLARIAADYEWLANLQSDIMDAQRCLADSRRLLETYPLTHRGTVQ